MARFRGRYRWAVAFHPGWPPMWMVSVTVWPSVSVSVCVSLPPRVAVTCESTNRCCLPI